MDEYEYLDVYGNLCVFLGVYGGLLESMEKYEYTSVYDYLREFVRFYGSLWGLLEYMGGGGLGVYR